MVDIEAGAALLAKAGATMDFDGGSAINAKAGTIRLNG